jgi:hypothetical protein
MSVFLQPIYTQTVGSGGAATVTFNSIPQTFTDLQVMVSGRLNNAASTTAFYVYFNGSNTAVYSDTYLQGSGSSIGSGRESNNVAAYQVQTPANASTSNTFGNSSLYIPNYTGTNFKSWITDGVSENNGTTAYQNLTAGLWCNTAAITSLSLTSYGNGDWLQYSTFTLYGITKG